MKQPADDLSNDSCGYRNQNMCDTGVTRRRDHRDKPCQSSQCIRGTSEVQRKRSLQEARVWSTILLVLEITPCKS